MTITKNVKKRKNLRSGKMTNNIGSISGGGSSWGVDWSNNSSNSNSVEENNAQEQGTNAQPERKDVNPDDVMRFLASQNYFMPVQAESASAANVDGVDAETEQRIASYMERFEEIYAVVEEEFGAELAPAVMDLVMDKLMGMV